jgi:hypothetical protein
VAQSLNDWTSFQDDILRHLQSLELDGADMPFFRGHSNHKWDLVCGLGRLPRADTANGYLESRLYYDFMSQASRLLHPSATSWDVLFAMQHHGIPTRLLDWTTALGPALYFAVRPWLLRSQPAATLIDCQPCIWVLDPFALNQLSAGNSVPSIGNPNTDFEGTYQENFIEQVKDLGAKVLAINPTRMSERYSAQRSAYTLHNDLNTPLEVIAPSAVKKFDVPITCIDAASAFLRLAGINEFSLFPDLDGLGRYLLQQHV